ncbi:MAG TPA: C4-dicarboxylic acid transporter DauA [Myxococcaceae bacterium]|nr:C4-dicarboxylic acid transporter DauA [Myxococcaceae bacterium]
MAHTRYRETVSAAPLRTLPAAALRAVLREGYSFRDLRSDVLAGAVVGVVALPLAMALSIAVGAPPQNGLYTSIVAGIAVGALGGSRTQVSGPTAAFVVILAPIYARFGLAGLLIAGLLGGLMLIGMGVARLGRLIEFIPHPVTTGFTAGIATVIATLQLKDAFGLSLTRNPESYFARVAAMFQARHTSSLSEAAIALGTLGLLIYLPRLSRRVPAPLLALPAMSIAALVLRHFVPGFQVATIGSRFHTMVAGRAVDGIPQLPPLPLLPWHQPGPSGLPFVLSLDTLQALITSAFAIAMLGAIESLLSAVVADGMAGTRHDPDAELLALGVGNVIAPFFGGIPATGAIARTATNIRSGARSPIAAIVHSFTVLVAVLALAPLIAYVPMASLAALLLLVAWNMAELKHFVRVIQLAPKSDVMVLLTCYSLTVMFDMVLAVSVGVVLAALLFMRRMAEVTHAEISEEQHPATKIPLPKGVIVYDIAGPLFFGAAQKAMSTLNRVSLMTRSVILRMDSVPAIDSTGLVALESALDQLEKRDVLTIITGLQQQPAVLLKKSNLENRRAKVLITEDLGSALVLAQTHAAEAPAGSGISE